MMITDRRYTRFVVEDHTFAALGKDYSKVGKIIDISLGGLAFEYLNDNQHSVNGVSMINLFSSVGGFHMSELTCRVICDFPTRLADRNVDGTLQKNRCSIQFTSISDAQRELLDEFIKNNTVGLASRGDLAAVRKE